MNKTKFKVGDKIVANMAKDGYFNEGATGEVIDLFESTENIRVKFDVDSYAKSGYKEEQTWGPIYFDLIKLPLPTPTHIAIVKGYDATLHNSIKEAKDKVKSLIEGGINIKLVTIYKIAETIKPTTSISFKRVNSK